MTPKPGQKSVLPSDAQVQSLNADGDERKGKLDISIIPRIPLQGLMLSI